MALPSWTQTGAAMWDVALNGVPFLLANTQNTPYRRDCKDATAQQLDTSGSVGEASLTGWWYRSQTSFHLGAGLRWLDGEKDANQYRFADSQGVDVWSEGVVSLLPATSLVSASSTTYARLVEFSNSGTEGVLVAEIGTSTMYTYTSTGTKTSVSGVGTTLHDVCSNRNLWFSAANGGIWSGALPGSSGTQQYTWPATPTGAGARLVWSQQRLWAMSNGYVWALSGAAANPTLSTTVGGGTAETYPIFKHAVNGWNWTHASPAPDGVFLAGYAADLSEVYFASWDDTNARYATPRLVAELPKGEVVYSMEPYLGAYLLLATSSGVRVALIQRGGVLEVGPLTLETQFPCRDLCVYDRFVWAVGGAAPPSDPHAPVVKLSTSSVAGLHRIDMSQTVVDGKALFPHARDLEYASANTTGACSVAFMGQSGRVAFWVNGVGLVAQSATTRVSSGWLETGRIRMGTLEPKVFQYLRVLNYNQSGTLDVKWRDQGATLSSSLTSWSGTAYQQINTDGSDQSAQMFVSYRFGLSNSGSQNPGLWGYQAKTQPSGVPDVEIQVPLLCFEREKPAGGPAVDRPVWDRVADIETAQAKNSVVRFQDFGTGEDINARIVGVSFISSVTPTTAQSRAQRGGTLVVTLRKVT